MKILITIVAFFCFKNVVADNFNNDSLRRKIDSVAYEILCEQKGSDWCTNTMYEIDISCYIDSSNKLHIVGVESYYLNESQENKFLKSLRVNEIVLQCLNQIAENNLIIQASEAKSKAFLLALLHPGMR